MSRAAAGAHPAVVEGAAALLRQVAIGGVARHDLRSDAVRVAPADLATRRVQPGGIQILRTGAWWLNIETALKSNLGHAARLGAITPQVTTQT